MGQGWTEISAEFLRGSLGYRRKKSSSFKQSIARAVGLKAYGLPLKILDLMAGLGKDAFILANLGCRVTLVERSPLVAALLKDGLERAKKDSEMRTVIEQNMKFIHSDAENVLDHLAKDDIPDIIYLDPMFPENRSHSLTKIEKRVIRELVGGDEDAPRVLEKALALEVKRVVVKRPKGAPNLGGIKPDIEIESKKIRYDVYLKRHNSSP